MYTRLLALLLTVLPSLPLVPLAQAQVISALQRSSLAPTTNAQGESYSYDPTMDGAGRYVIFTSTSDSFAAEGNTAGQYHEHLYLRDTITGATTQLDVTASGQTGSPGTAFSTNIRTFSSSFDPQLSRDGVYVVFSSTASNISPDGQGESYGAWVYLKNLSTGEIRRIPFATASDPTKSEYPAYLAINADGSVVVLITIVGNIDDTTGASSVWELHVFDRVANTTTRIDTGVTGNKFNPAISDDGNFIVFENQSGDFSAPTYSYLYDRTLAQTSALNQGKTAQGPAISGDGNYIAYTDTSNTFMPIRLLERQTGSESVITRGYDGSEPVNISDFASLSIDGRYIAFLSAASNLVANDRNDVDDIFVFDRVSGKTTLVSVSGACNGITSKEEFNTGPPVISSDGKRIVFSVLERLVPADRKDSAGNLIEPADSNRFEDIYVAELDYDTTPAPFSSRLTPSTPLASVSCGGNTAALQLAEITKSSADVRGKAPAIRSITQQITIKKINPENGRRSTIRRTTAKRNQVSYTNLGPGSYSAQVQAVAKYKGGRTTKSKLSLPAFFNITE